jgi:hypothetical protein
LGIYAAGKALSSAQTGHPDYWALILAGLASGLANGHLL